MTFEIRDSDRGQRVRRFRLTSVELDQTLDVCIGIKYVHEGADGQMDRYNVYRVEDGAVGNGIGYYELPVDSIALDADGDFNIQKIGEPTWTISKKTIVIPSIVPPSIPPKVSKGDFTIINTKPDGNCFFETIIRALDETTTDLPNRIIAFRADLANYIRTNKQFHDMIISRHKLYEDSRDTDDTLRSNPHYVKYWNMCLNDDQAIKSRMSETKIDDADMDRCFDAARKEAIKNERTNQDFSIDKFKRGNEVEKSNADSIKHEIGEYYIDQDDPSSHLKTRDVILATFTDKLENTKIWANDIIYYIVEEKYNVKIVPFIIGHEDRLTSRLEDLNPVNMSDFGKVKLDGQFILTDYSPNIHYNLIQYKDKTMFKLNDLPKPLVDKMMKHSSFDQLTSEPSPVVDDPAPVVEPVVDTPAPVVDTPAPVVDDPVPVVDAKIVFPDGFDEFTIPKLKEFASANDIKIKSSVTKKADLIDCIRHPDQEKCRPKSKSKRVETNKTRRSHLP